MDRGGDIVGGRMGGVNAKECRGVCQNARLQIKMQCGFYIRVRARACGVERGMWAILLGGVVGTVSLRSYALFVGVCGSCFGLLLGKAQWVWGGL